MNQFFQALTTSIGGTLVLAAAFFMASACGAWVAVRLLDRREDRKRHEDVRATVNIAIAELIALLGKLINLKKDLVFPALAGAEMARDSFDNEGKDKPSDMPGQIRLDLWPEFNLVLHTDRARLFDAAAQDLDVVQLIKMLDCNLLELSHYVRQRNGVISRMNRYQEQNGRLPNDGLKVYIALSSEIARNVDENLFFIDRAIEKIRTAAVRSLPKRLRSGIADIAIKAEASPLMPPKDFIKGWIR